MKKLDQLTRTGKMQWWRFIIGLLLIILAVQLGSVPYYLTLFYKKSTLNLKDDEFLKALETLDNTVFQIDQITFLVLVLLVFAIAFGITAVLIPKLHKTKFKYFLTERAKYDWKRTTTAFLVWFLLISVFVLLFIPDSSFTYQLDFKRFIMLLLVAILLIPFQAAFEEMVFRGYLFSGIKMAAKSNFITLIITSSLFSLVHAFNPEFEISFWKLFLFYFGCGFALGLITVIDKGIELAVGAHTAYNIFLFTVLSTVDGSLNVPSIFQTTSKQLIEVMPYVLFFVVDISVVIFFLKYNWIKAFNKPFVFQVE